MNAHDLKAKINRNEKFKWFVHRCMISHKRTVPRLWVKLFLNPFFSKRDKGSIVKWTARLNVSPINPFGLGRDSIIEDYTVIDNAVGAVTIGSDSRIGLRNTVIGPVKIGSHVITAQNVVLSGLNHNYQDIHTPIRKQGISMQPIVIADDVWIGANSTVTAGATIGSHCVVAAGSVVVGQIPAYSICAGAPARVIKQYDFECGEWVKKQK